MVAGYTLQAAGIGITAFGLRKHPTNELRRSFIAAIVLFTAISFPAMLTNSTAGAIVFGCLMNGLCGVISGFYLYIIGRRGDANRRGVIFGGGYALATVSVGLWAAVGQAIPFRGWGAPTFALLLSAGMIWMIHSSGLLSPDETYTGQLSRSRAPESIKKRDWLLVCGSVVLISLVKNLGFGFPSADIEAGLIPEISRIPYAAGLALAGLINDRNRRHGMLCTVSALILPFLMLGLAEEPIACVISWGLDYFFFGFFSVFRVVLFFDLADQTRHPDLAPLGLLLGRMGDAAGTTLYLLLAGNKIALIGIAAILFVPTVFILFLLHQWLYEPEIVQQRSEQEVFEVFCLHNDLTAREREIFRLILANQTNGEIAEALFISENTVKYHVKNVLQKTGCKKRGELQNKFTIALYPSVRESTNIFSESEGATSKNV